jgi:hypothetical protein
MSAAPPIGLIPKFVRDRERAQEILTAMSRYVEAGKPIPRGWVNELLGLADLFEPQYCETQKI